ncbi:unnamed protein product [Trichobilharzia regenti]|nr:unnamed protein product [Trichobilharzia regenti]
MCQIIELPEDGPTCPHGIMLKIVNKSSESFHYACSAFRGKDECKRQELCRKNTLNNWSVENILSSDQSNRAYCSTCDCLFSMVTERKKHKMHEYRGDLSDNLLTMPSYLLKPLGDSKAHATNFYRSHNFSQYNMVNGFFFSQQDKENFYNFIKENVKSMHKCLIFCDPPFAAPLSLIIKQIKVLQNSVIRLRLFIKMTYENHSRLDCDRNNPDISQSNTINNENQANRGKRRDSVVRLFTNLSPSLVHPPESLESSFRYSFIYCV